MNNLDLYLKFRQEIDKICVPELLKCVEELPITVTTGKRGGKLHTRQIGLMCVAHEERWDYIDSLYIIPKERRKGIGKGAVKAWYEKQGREARLHIIHKNEAAQKFWRSIFDLELIEENYIDGLYRIRGLKK